MSNDPSPLGAADDFEELFAASDADAPQQAEGAAESEQAEPVAQAPEAPESPVVHEEPAGDVLPASVAPQRPVAPAEPPAADAVQADEVRAMFSRLEDQLNVLTNGLVRLSERQADLEANQSRQALPPAIETPQAVAGSEDALPEAAAPAPPVEAVGQGALPALPPAPADDEFADLFEMIDEAAGAPTGEATQTREAIPAPPAAPAPQEPLAAAPIEPVEAAPSDEPDGAAPADEAPSGAADPWEEPLPSALQAEEPWSEPETPTAQKPWDAAPATEPETPAPAAEPWDMPGADAPASEEPWDAVPSAAPEAVTPDAEPWDVPEAPIAGEEPGAPAPAAEPWDAAEADAPAPEEPWDAPQATPAAEPWDATPVAPVAAPAPAAEPWDVEEPAAPVSEEPWDQPAEESAPGEEPWDESVSEEPWDAPVDGGSGWEQGEDFSHMVPAAAEEPASVSALPVDLVWAIGEQNSAQEEVQLEQLALDSMRRQARESTTSRSRRGSAKPAKLPFNLLRQGDPLVMAVYSPKGGAGKSTTAMNLGAYLADSGRRMAAKDKAGAEPPRICVIDGDIGNGNLAIRVADRTEPNLLNLQEWMDAHDGRAPDDYDSPDERVATIRDFMLWTRDLPNLNILAAPSNPEAYDDFTPADYEHLLQELGRHFDVIIIDCGTEIVMESTKTWLRFAHQVFLLTLPERAALHSAGKAARLIARPTNERDILVTPDKLNIVMMRSDADLGLNPEFGMQKTFPWADGQNTFYFSDFDLEAGQANNRGSFLALENQTYSEQIGALAQIAFRNYRTTQAATR